MKTSTAVALAGLLLWGLTGGRLHAADDHGGRPLNAVLTGEAEVPGPGDPDGAGTLHLVLNPGQQQICYDLRVSNVAPSTAAHVHRGRAGESGPPVVTLRPPSAGAVEDCLGEVERELIQTIIQDPAGYYVNVHNDEYPSGAVRGQLSHSP